MRVNVTLPDLGEDSVQNAKIAFWLVEVGAHVNEGDEILELTTDKAAFTLPAPQSGTLIERLKKEGEQISTGDAICVFEV